MVGAATREGKRRQIDVAFDVLWYQYAKAQTGADRRGVASGLNQVLCPMEGKLSLVTIFLGRSMAFLRTYGPFGGIFLCMCFTTLSEAQLVVLIEPDPMGSWRFGILACLQVAYYLSAKRRLFFHG